MTQVSATIGLLATLAQSLVAPAAPLPDQSPAQLGRSPQAPKTQGPSPKSGSPFVLFAPATPLPTQPTPRGGATAPLRDLPKVVCGMVVVPVDPALDPRMVKSVPSDTTFTMRVIAPPVCWDSQPGRSR